MLPAANHKTKRTATNLSSLWTDDGGQRGGITPIPDNPALRRGNSAPPKLFGITTFENAPSVFQCESPLTVK